MTPVDTLVNGKFVSSTAVSIISFRPPGGAGGGTAHSRYREVRSFVAAMNTLAFRVLDIVLHEATASYNAGARKGFDIEG